MTGAPLRLVVLGDSRSFANHANERLELDDPSLFHQQLVARLAEALDREVEVRVVARSGNGMRLVLLDVQHWTSSRQDLRCADVVVLHVGMDAVPWVGGPLSQQKMMQIGDGRAGRRLRRAHVTAARRLSTLTRGALPATRAANFRRYTRLVVTRLRKLNPDALVVSTSLPHFGPVDGAARRIMWSTPAVGRMNLRSQARSADLEQIVLAHGPSVHVDLRDLERQLEDGDGTHYSPALHHRIAQRLAENILPRFDGRRATHA